MARGAADITEAEALARFDADGLLVQALATRGDAGVRQEVLGWAEAVQDEAAPWLEVALAVRCPGFAAAFEAPPGWCRALLHERRLGPRWRLVRALDLRDLPLSYPHLRLITEAPELEGLRQLDLSGVPLRQRGAMMLAQARFLGGLEALRLASCSLWPQAVEALIAHTPMPALTVLDLTGNPIGPRGAIALARTAHLPALEVLTLPEDAQSARAQDALRLAPHRHLTNAVARFPVLRHQALWGAPPTRQDDAARFGTLRALLDGEQTPTRWVQVCALLTIWPEARRHELLPYVQSHLARWPERVLVLPQGFVAQDDGDAGARRLDPLASMCRALVLRSGISRAPDGVDLGNASTMARLLCEPTLGPLTVMRWCQPMRHALHRDDALDALSRHPWRELYLERAMYHYERDQTLELLCAPWTRRLEVLGLLDARHTLDPINEDGLIALGHHLERLHTLAIDGLQTYLGALDALERPEVFPSLTRVVLPAAWRERADVRRLARQPRHRDLLCFEPLDEVLS